jgi:hypothetical protein
MTGKNLDTMCAECAYTIVQDVAANGKSPKSDKSKLENTITKSLGVLQEQGVYAFFLFLAYRKGELGANQTTQYTWEMLRIVDASLSEASAGKPIPWDELRELTNDLDKLLLARELLEQTLIYARYHAKALDEQEETTEQTATQQAEEQTP